MTKIHLIEDATMGGIKREYIEVDREAEVGDYVWFVHSKESGLVDAVWLDITNSGIERGDVKALDPTDTIHIGDQLYKRLDNEAEAEG